MHLLFVCTGNTCRSPLAETIARRMIADRHLAGITVSSAGTSAWPDSSASDGALLVSLEHGTDITGHRARPLSPDIVASADVILAMGPHHLERAEAMGGAGRAFLLTAFTGGEGRAVSDPFGGDLDVYRDTYRELEQEIASVLEKLAGQRPG
ncbi:low molecular weight protein arginine phosphatase [Gemmatimonas phototrophica]|uniref:protein-tyrosine-phosphatase n=1 Tax=Gemmatimonas phototrophica TaxID=1379270 RepID=A0A143BIS5_9BACT|nr:low molecular weight protein arginine phosphatase [Gemmatimonas phototrophica]AMW04947.1 hypothetical protein GEMMAAP_09105 [Gemmatimonas phototrophica]